MKLEATTIVIEPRSMSACIDLTLVFYRRYASAFLKVTIPFVAAGALSSYVLATVTDHGLLWSAVGFWFLSPLASGLVVAGAGHVVFGARCAPLLAFRASGAQRPFLLWTLAARILTAFAGLPCLGLTGIPVALYFGFVPEILLLERVPSPEVRRRVSELMRGGSFELFGRALVLAFFSAALAATLFTLVDQASRVVAQSSIFWDRVDSSSVGDSMIELLATDPPVVTVLSAIGWLVFPFARLVWFFCYLDRRIRKEAWDLELDFRIEARRLETAG